MEYRVKLFLIKISMIVSLIISALFVIPADVMAQDRIKYKDMSKEEAEKTLQSVNFRTCDIEDFKEMPIQNLLVSKDWVAVGVQKVVMGVSKNAVGIFDLQGDLEYAVTFDTTGIHSLYYDNKRDSLVIYIPRASTYFTLDSEGNIIFMEGYDANYSKKKKHKNFTDKNGNKYLLSSGSKLGDVLFTERTVVKQVRVDGKTEIFFQTTYGNDKQILVVITVIILFLIMIFWGWKYGVFKKPNYSE